jgi:hypothetical protein
MSENKSVVKTKQKLPFKVRFKSFTAGINKFFRLNRIKLVNFFKSREFKIPRDAILKILFNGFMFSCLYGLFVGFSDKILLLKLIPILGFGWYILKKEIFPETRQLISSINLVRLTK